jgi:hypothetical protein
MNDTSEYIKRAAKRIGFKREFFVEKNIPTHSSNIFVLPFFCDLKSTFILSSLILNNFKKHNPDKYIILCSWPGMQSLFPYVDEYWTVEDESLARAMSSGANDFFNDSNIVSEIIKNIAEVVDIITPRELKKYYSNGFTKEYWKDFPEVERFLPEIASANVISEDFKLKLSNNEKNIVVYPATKMKSWQRGVSKNLPIQKEFWINLVDELIKEGYNPVIYQNWFTYDVSKDLADKCTYLVPKSISDLLAGMREVGMVLDVHTGISRMAIAARCPFLSVTERSIYIGDKDYEIDDLCASNLPRQYIFSFSTQLMTGTIQEWKISLIDTFIKRLNIFYKSIDNKKLPSTNISFEKVSNLSIRKRNKKRLGVNFIKTSKNK